LVVAAFWCLTAVVEIAPMAGALGSVTVGLPLLGSGDEPHYFVMLNSILRRGNLDVATTYEEARLRGENTAGARYRLAPLSHHTLVHTRDGHLFRWEWVYGGGPAAFYPDGRWRPTPPYDSLDLTGAREVPWHPIALPLLLSGFCAPFRGAPSRLEHVAVLFAALAAGLAVVAVLESLYRLGASPRTAGLCAGMLGLCTPLWHYSKSLFPDAYVAGAVSWHFLLLPLLGRPFLSGLVLGAGFAVKWPIILLVVPDLLVLLAARRWRTAFWLLAGLAPSLLFQAGCNWWAMGTPFRFTISVPHQWQLHRQLYPLLFGDGHGLFTFSPWLLFAIPGAIQLLRRHPYEGSHLVGLLITGLGYFASIPAGWDAWSYGSRELLAVVPLLAVAAGTSLQSLSRPRPQGAARWEWSGRDGHWAASTKRALVLAAFVGLGLAGFVLNAVGAFYHLAVYGVGVSSIMRTLGMAWGIL
jgi:hypothetical protein